MMPPAPPESPHVITFAGGLPGFEACQRYVLAAAPPPAPFTCVHGVEPSAPSFLAIDPRHVVAGYACPLTPADRARLAAGPDAPLLWLALVTADADRATVNLRAPLVVNPATMLGIQVAAADSPYPFDYPLGEL